MSDLQDLLETLRERDEKAVSAVPGRPFVTDLMEQALAEGDTDRSWGWMPSENELGMTVYSAEIRPTTRYGFDARICARSKGWRQYDTTSDASYFGIWVHVDERVIFKFVEGDAYLLVAPDKETFKAELKSMADFYGEAPPAATVFDFDDDGRISGVTEVYDPRPTGDE
jgi:hypothetical protein